MREHKLAYAGALHLALQAARDFFDGETGARLLVARESARGFSDGGGQVAIPLRHRNDDFTPMRRRNANDHDPFGEYALDFFRVDLVSASLHYVVCTAGEKEAPAFVEI